mmetsp:Transcript_114916/g.329990  ORF Transcript_114916/g.329990 Transcript_114916/m.329990 type:complete len:382 (-) Transcript_114916:162-1307(-)
MLQDVLGHDAAEVKLVDEAAALLIQQDASAATQRFRAQVLRVRAGVLRIDEGGGVKLDFVHIDQGRSDLGAELDAIAIREGPVRRGDADQVGAVLLHQAAFAVVEAETACRDDDRIGMQLVRRARHFVLVLEALDFLLAFRRRLLDESQHRAPRLDLDVVVGVGRRPRVLHDRETHGHRRAVGPRRHTVCPLAGVTAELGQRRQGHAKLVHEPMDGLGALLGQRRDAAEVRLATLGGHMRVALEEPAVVIHAIRLLHPRPPGVDAARGLGGVTADLAFLFEQCHLCSGLGRLDGRADAGEAAAHDDHARWVVPRQPILAVLRCLARQLLVPHHARAGARVQDVVGDRVLEGGTAEHVQQPPAVLDHAGRHGGGGERVGQHA